MRKKMLLLAMSLALLAGSLSTSRAAVASGTHACPICTTYADGSQCCVSCICDDTTGRRIACTDHYCPPAGGLN
jgi:hypothetical protein